MTSSTAPPELLPTTLDDDDPYYQCMEMVQHKCNGIGWYAVHICPSPRIIVATENRKKLIDSVSLNIDCSGCIVEVIETELKKCKAATTNRDRFDHMLAISYTVAKDDSWMELHINDKCLSHRKDVFHSCLKAFGDTWLQLLAMSNDDLRVDAEFSRPAVEALLEQFSESLDSLRCMYKVNWRPSITSTVSKAEVSGIFLKGRKKRDKYVA